MAAPAVSNSWSAGVLAACALLLGAYLSGIGGRGSAPPAVRARRAACCGTALAVLATAYATPLPGRLSAGPFSLRVLQAVLTGFVAAPLLLTSLPPRWLRGAVRPAPARRVLAALVRPLPALLPFHAELALYLTRPGAAAAALAWAPLLLVTALLMWAPLLVRIPGLPDPSVPAQLLYLFANWLVVTLGFGLLLFSAAGPPPAGGPLLGAARLDRQLGAVFLGVGSHLAYFVLLTIIFVRWAQQEAVTATPDRLLRGLRRGGWSEAEARHLAGLAAHPERGSDRP